MPESNGFIVAAYVLTWVALIGYVVHLRRARLEATRRWRAVTRDTREVPQ